MVADDVAHDRQPEAGAAGLARAGLLHPVEAVEHPLALVLGDAGAVVGDGEQDDRRPLRRPGRTRTSTSVAA